MNANTATLMTTDELLALPDDGVERWLIRGELREKQPAPGALSITIRNRFHSRVLMIVGQMLLNWLDRQPEPRGQVFGGEAGVRLRCNPEATVGVDVVYLSAEVAARQTEDTTLIDGVPVLAVEILSPSDTQEDIHEKIDEYLAVGVTQVWVIDPADRTVRVYRPDAKPQLFNEDQELSGEPQLPGFRAPVARLFG
jgi:Uma2 family endonuclease